MTIPATALDTTLTTRHPNMRTGRLEVWEATSSNGDWTYLREEDAGTHWDIRHNPTGRIREFAATTLTKARRLTEADGVDLFT